MHISWCMSHVRYRWLSEHTFGGRDLLASILVAVFVCAVSSGDHRIPVRHATQVCVSCQPWFTHRNILRQRLTIFGNENYDALIAYQLPTLEHKRTSQGAESCKAKFFGQKPAAKNEKKDLLNAKKRNSFRPARLSTRNLGFLLTIGWG